jgi:hypothetical protein
MVRLAGPQFVDPAGPWGFQRGWKNWVTKKELGSAEIRRVTGAV